MTSCYDVNQKLFKKISSKLISFSDIRSQIASDPAIDCACHRSPPGGAVLSFNDVHCGG